MKKRFLYMDAQGTDGAKPEKMLAVFEVLDDEGFCFTVTIAGDKADGGNKEDAAIVAEAGKKPAAKTVVKTG